MFVLLVLVGCVVLQKVRKLFGRVLSDLGTAMTIVNSGQQNTLIEIEKTRVGILSFVSGRNERTILGMGHSAIVNLRSCI